MQKFFFVTKRSHRHRDSLGQSEVLSFTFCQSFRDSLLPCIATAFTHGRVFATLCFCNVTIQKLTFVPVLRYPLGTFSPLPAVPSPFPPTPPRSLVLFIQCGTGFLARDRREGGAEKEWEWKAFSPLLLLLPLVPLPTICAAAKRTGAGLRTAPMPLLLFFRGMERKLCLSKKSPPPSPDLRAIHANHTQSQAKKIASYYQNFPLLFC